MSGEALNQSSVEWTTTGTGTFESENNLETIYTPSPEDIDSEGVTLELTVFDDNDNSFSDELFLTIIPEIVNITEQKQINYSIYPNPSNGKFYLKYNTNDSENICVKLLNITGIVIYYNDFLIEKNNNYIQFNFENLSKGTYLLEIQDNQSITVKKIVIY